MYTMKYGTNSARQSTTASPLAVEISIAQLLQYCDLLRQATFPIASSSCGRRPVSSDVSRQDVPAMELQNPRELRSVRGSRKMARMALLTREQIETALTMLDAEIGRAGRRASIHLVGGAVMCLVFRARESTRDVDAWFDEPGVVRAAAARVAEALQLPADWLNDAAKGFLPAGAQFESWRALPNLEIFVANARTLFAMKSAAARTAEDAEDIRVLARELGITSPREALAVVEQYYAADRLPVRTRLLLEEMFHDRP
jgi:hypothetical protein